MPEPNAAPVVFSVKLLPTQALAVVLVAVPAAGVPLHTELMVMPITLSTPVVEVLLKLTLCTDLAMLAAEMV